MGEKIIVCWMCLDFNIMFLLNLIMDGKEGNKLDDIKFGFRIMK